MKKIIIAIGADHRGFATKEYVKKIASTVQYAIEWRDVGAHNAQRSDYPVFASDVVRVMQEKNADYGVLVCGTGIGMAIAANRAPGIYAGLVWNADVARRAKEDDNVNVLVLPADYCTLEEARAMLCAWLDSKFKHERYEKRIAMIDDLMRQEQQ